MITADGHDFFQKKILFGTSACPCIFSERLDSAEFVWLTLKTKTKLVVKIADIPNHNKQQLIYKKNNTKWYQHLNIGI